MEETGIAHEFMCSTRFFVMIKEKLKKAATFLQAELYRK